MVKRVDGFSARNEKFGTVGLARSRLKGLGTFKICSQYLYVFLALYYQNPYKIA